MHFQFLQKLKKKKKIKIKKKKKLLKTTRNKKRRHNKIVMLARSKLNSIESRISEALINTEISHQDFVTIINEEKKFQN